MKFELTFLFCNQPSSEVRSEQIFDQPRSHQPNSGSEGKRKYLKINKNTKPLNLDEDLVAEALKIQIKN